MFLRGSTGGGATSSRHVMAVLSSQGRGDAATLPSLVNRGTASIYFISKLSHVHSET